MSKLEKLTMQRGALVAKLQSLQAELDEAAEGADTALIAQLQSEIGAVRLMIDSADRRLEKARTEDAGAARQARKDANTALAETFAKEVAQMRKLAAPVAATVSRLAEQLEAVKAHGDIARKAVGELTRQIPFGERPHFWLSILNTADMQPTMGIILEDLMSKHGIFNTVAMNSRLVPRHHGFTSIDDVFAAHGEHMRATVQKIAQSINKGV